MNSAEKNLDNEASFKRENEYNEGTKFTLFDECFDEVLKAESEIPLLHCSEQTSTASSSFAHDENYVKIQTTFEVSDASQETSAPQNKIHSKVSSALNDLFHTTLNFFGKTFRNVSKKFTNSSTLSADNADSIKTEEFRTTLVAPWVGLENEEILKEECLALSTDSKIFTKSPSKDSGFQFDYDKFCPLALRMLKEDPKLRNVRYELVPRRISEEDFWKNYFHRMHLIFKAHGQLLDNDNLELTTTSCSFEY